MAKSNLDAIASVPAAELKMDRALRRLMTVVIIVLSVAVVAVGATLFIVVDCTQPGRGCFNRSKEGGAELVRTLMNDNRQIHGLPTVPPASDKP